VSGRPRNRIDLGFSASAGLVARYAGGRLKAQALAILPVVGYLVFLRTVILGLPMQDALAVAGGVLACGIGLAAFLEGLFLAVMPLGKSAGLAMGRKMGVAVSLIVSLALGAVAVLAEPAIAFLKALGSNVLPWRAPLLYHLLNRGATSLMIAICAGVGLAVALGVARFRQRLPFKPIIFTILPVLVALTAYASSRPDLRSAIGLAWDSGAIVTGPVTVPMVLALGIGLTRARGGRAEGTTEGYGVVAFAAALPAIAILVLAIMTAGAMPASSSPEAFFSPGNDARTAPLFGGEAGLEARALAALGPGAYESVRGEPPPQPAASAGPSGGGRAFWSSIGSQAVAAAQAVLPLALALVLVLAACRERPRHYDEIGLGVILALSGMFLLNAGMVSGFGRLGDQAGMALPVAYASIPDPAGEIVIEGFDASLVRESISPSGARKSHFYLDDGSARARKVEYDPAAFDRATGRYAFQPMIGPRFGPPGGFAGPAILLLLVFLLGFGATIAEPSLAALGETVEEQSVGTFSKRLLVLATALGVGVGAALGAARLLTGLPLGPVLIAAYALIALFTAFSDDSFAALAWDAAGVTTGPVTVPLVIALGLGLGESRGAADSFGILACAGALPAVTVLIAGLRFSRRGGKPARRRPR